MPIKTNTKNVLKSLVQLGEEGAEEIAISTFANAKGIEEDAKVKAPKNVGKLAQSINTERKDEKGYHYAVNVGLTYGAYVEFGTGKRVQVPAELQAIASEIEKINTKGTFKKGLRSIQDWCRSKGIDEKAAYPIFMSILKKGLHPQPYLYPAFVKGKVQYLKDLKTALKKITKKFNK